MNKSLEKDLEKDIKKLKEVLEKYKKKRKILLAYLFGSLAEGKIHPRSDIDLAVYLTGSEREKLQILEELLVSVKRDLDILRLDDEDESPFIVQKALKGIPLIEPDEEILYQVWDRALHESEHIRLKRGINEDQTEDIN